MLSAEQIQGLKRTNISVSSDKTKLRFEEIFKPAKIKQKQAVRELAGVTSQVAHNIYNTGNISIKMVLAVSQVLNVNPFYLTGEADEPGEFSGEALRDLLLKHGYSDLAASIELPEKKSGHIIAASLRMLKLRRRKRKKILPLRKLRRYLPLPHSRWKKRIRRRCSVHGTLEPRPASLVPKNDWSKSISYCLVEYKGQSVAALPFSFAGIPASVFFSVRDILLEWVVQVGSL